MRRRLTSRRLTVELSDRLGAVSKRADDDLLATRTRKRAPLAEEALDERVPALTILAHPDAQRIGERAILLGLDAGEDVALSRLSPRFTSPPGALAAKAATAGPRPLADPFLSREALASIGLVDGEFCIQKRGGRGVLRVDGVALDGARRIEASRLDAGAVLELDDRVVLLLHRALAAAGRPPPRFGFAGDSDAIRKLRRDLDRVARTELRVLVRGATGSGKELAARAIHDASARATGPYEAINMAAIQPSLAASALFGHVRGAFSGAVSDHDGHFAAADGGTLFLDEIGDTDAAVQAMLLRTLETREVVRVGDRKARKVDVRFLSATDADLEGAVASGRFREPLLHRVAEATVRVPSLTERRDDVGRLVVHFARGLLTADEQACLLDDERAEQPWLSAPVVARLARAPWTGNVRQLQNVVRQLVVQGRHEPHLTVSPELEALLASAPRTPRGDAATDAPASPASPTVEKGRARAPETRGRKPQELTDDDILAALEQTGFKRAAAADLLGIARSSLYARVAANERLRRSRELTADHVREALARHGGDVERAAEALEISAHGLKLRMHALGVAD